MKNKFINLIFQEPVLGVKMVAVVLLATMITVLHKETGLRQQGLVNLIKNRQEVLKLEPQIPILEAKLKAFEEQGKVVAPSKRNLNLSLKGILTKDGESVALLNGEMYRKNNMVSGLIITSITSNTVTFFDPKTSEESKIQIPE